MLVRSESSFPSVNAIEMLLANQIDRVTTMCQASSFIDTQLDKGVGDRVVIDRYAVEPTVLVIDVILTATNLRVIPSVLFLCGVYGSLVVIELMQELFWHYRE